MTRPNDRVVYTPLRLQNQARQQSRQAQLEARRLAHSVRPEKKHGRRLP